MSIEDPGQQKYMHRDGTLTNFRRKKLDFLTYHDWKFKIVDAAKSETDKAKEL